MHATEIPNFEALTDLERIALAELLASVRDPSALAAPITHKIELDRRWAEYEKNSAIGVTTEQFWKQVDALQR